MSEIGYYELQLYCDREDCDYGFAKFTDRTLMGCRRQARREGWAVDRKRLGTLHGGAHAICPKHNKKKGT